MNKKVIRVLTVLAVIFMVAVPLRSNAEFGIIGEYYYEYNINDVNRGYTFGIWQDKISGYNLYWVGADYNSLGNSVPTNYIVIGMDGTQIAYNTIITVNTNNAYSNYYSANHAGPVYLRANSGSTLVGYRVKGHWSPNACYC